MDWTVIMNFTISAKTFSSILIEDLKKNCICIGDFDILKAGSNKTFSLDVNNTISKVFYNDPDFKLISSNSNIDVTLNKTKKDSEII